jgi:hypothetical protein
VLECTRRRICFSVSVAKQDSTRLIHDVPVGVKCLTLSDKKPIQFHVTCFQLWDAERRAGTEVVTAFGSMHAPEG